MIILVSELIIIVCSVKDVTAADPPVRSPHDRQKILAPNDSFGGDLMEILTLIITMVDDLDKDWLFCLGLRHCACLPPKHNGVNCCLAEREDS